MRFRKLETIKKEMPFNSRNWNYQKIIRYLLQDDNGRIIESMVIWHLKDNEVVEFILELSNMYNCNVGCQFCASGALDKSPSLLKYEDFFEQVNIMLDDSKANPNDYKKFSISFTGIGEPSTVYKDLGFFMQDIQKKYKHVTFIIGTFGYKIDCFSYWLEQEVRIKTLQIPFYSCDLIKLKKIVRNLPSDYSFLDILINAIKYKEKAKHEKCRVKVNYLVMKDINDKNEDIEKMIQLVYPYREQIEIRVSYLNYTKQAEKYGYSSPSFERIREIEMLLKENGFESYSFGTDYNHGIACGQLAQNGISE